MLKRFVRKRWLHATYLLAFCLSSYKGTFITKRMGAHVMVQRRCETASCVSGRMIHMAEAAKAIPKDWKVLLDEETMTKCIARISYEIIERNEELDKVAIVGIRTCGEFLGRRIQAKIKEVEGREIPFGVLDITLYRDDLSRSKSQPTLQGTDLPFGVSGMDIILVDDVLFTGRTVRAAMDAIIDFGRPKRVQLAVLADRGHRELPIRPDYVGKNLPTNRNEFVRVVLREQGFLQDSVCLTGVAKPKTKENGKEKGRDS